MVRMSCSNKMVSILIRKPRWIWTDKSMTYIGSRRASTDLAPSAESELLSAIGIEMTGSTFISMFAGAAGVDKVVELLALLDMALCTSESASTRCSFSSASPWSSALLLQHFSQSSDDALRAY